MRRRRERERLEAELGAALPYLALAREIHSEVARVAADPSAHGELLAELIEWIPQDKRMALAQTIFDRLSSDAQWAVIERVYGDDEIRTYLEAERVARLAEVRLGAGRQDICRRARASRELDTGDIPPGEQLTLGLFRDNDVRAALSRGHTATTCARRLVLRALGGARFRLIEDSFNPSGGYFVTAEYSADTWRDHDRIDGHAIVRVGSITGGDSEASLEPVLYPAGRVDFEIGGRASRGLLHLGFAMLGDIDIFVP